MADYNLQELMLRRRLEKYEGGGPAKVGQYKAVIFEEQAIVSWVGEDGVAAQIFCHFADDEWVAHPQILRIGTNYIELRPVARSFGLNEDIVRAIQDAQKNKKPKKKAVKDVPQA